MYRSQKIHHPCSYEMHVRKKTTFFFKVLFYFSFSLELSPYFSKSGNTRLLLLQFEYCPPDETCTYLTVLFQYFSPKRPSYLLHCIPFFLLRVPLHFSFQFLQRLYLPKTVLQLLDTNTKLQLGTTSKNFTFSQHQHLIINNTLKVQFFYLVMNFPKLQTK